MRQIYLQQYTILNLEQENKVNTINIVDLDIGSVYWTNKNTVKKNSWILKKWCRQNHATSTVKKNLHSLNFFERLIISIEKM